MSGGHFDYIEFRIDEVVTEIEKLIIENKKVNEYGFARNYSEETIENFKEAIKVIILSSKMIRRIDYLVSGDDDEKSFHERWIEDDII
jgi:hypothetical protein